MLKLLKLVKQEDFDAEQQLRLAAEEQLRQGEETIHSERVARVRAETRTIEAEAERERGYQLLHEANDALIHEAQANREQVADILRRFAPTEAEKRGGAAEVNPKSFDEWSDDEFNRAIELAESAPALGRTQVKEKRANVERIKRLQQAARDKRKTENK